MNRARAPLGRPTTPVGVPRPILTRPGPRSASRRVLSAAAPVRQGPGEIDTTSATAGSHSSVSSRAPASASSAGPLSVSDRALARRQLGVLDLEAEGQRCGPTASTKLDETVAAFPRERPGRATGPARRQGSSARLKGSFGALPCAGRTAGPGTPRRNRARRRRPGREAGGSDGSVERRRRGLWRLEPHVQAREADVVLRADPDRDRGPPRRSAGRA